MLKDSVSIGDVLLGKYRVDRVIGEGGMGFVIEAYHLQLRERVALKFPKRQSLRCPGAAQRFISEARAAIRIKSEHVARVVDVNTLSDGTPFIVMEYLEGETLSQLAARSGPLAMETILTFVIQICEAIAEAHALGIVHRDLKPANIYLTRRADGILAAKILDFGISRMNDGSANDGSFASDQYVALGSPAYASPEQIQSPHSVDARSDLWSLGVLMYELASGCLPFDSATTVGLCGKVLYDAPPPLHDLKPELAPELCAIIDRCLKKRPQERYESVGYLALALRPFAPERARSSIERIARTVGASIESPERTNSPHASARSRVDVSSTPPVSVSRNMARVRRRSWQWIAGATLAMASASLGIPLYTHRKVDAHNGRSEATFLPKEHPMTANTAAGQVVRPSASVQMMSPGVSSAGGSGSTTLPYVQHPIRSRVPARKKQALASFIDADNVVSDLTSDTDDAFDSPPYANRK